MDSLDGQIWCLGQQGVRPGALAQGDQPGAWVHDDELKPGFTGVNQVQVTTGEDIESECPGSSPVLGWARNLGFMEASLRAMGTSVVPG